MLVKDTIVSQKEKEKSGKMVVNAGKTYKVRKKYYKMRKTPYDSCKKLFSFRKSTIILKKYR